MMEIEARAGALAADDALLIMGQLAIGTLPFDALQMHEAQEAWRRFGKGRHPAALNLEIVVLTRPHGQKVVLCFSEAMSLSRQMLKRLCGESLTTFPGRVAALLKLNHSFKK